ncbi:hypothetical protein EV121DRAFT_274824, partial [Schizophyllum commune]
PFANRNMVVWENVHDANSLLIGKDTNVGCSVSDQVRKLGVIVSKYDPACPHRTFMNEIDGYMVHLKRVGNAEEVVRESIRLTGELHGNRILMRLETHVQGDPCTDLQLMTVITDMQNAIFDVFETLKVMRTTFGVPSSAQGKLGHMLSRNVKTIYTGFGVVCTIVTGVNSGITLAAAAAVAMGLAGMFMQILANGMGQSLNEPTRHRYLQVLRLSRYRVTDFRPSWDWERWPSLGCQGVPSVGEKDRKLLTEFPDRVRHVLEPPKRWPPFAITYVYILHGPYMHILLSLCQVEQYSHDYRLSIFRITVFQEGISALLKLPNVKGGQDGHSRRCSRRLQIRHSIQDACQKASVAFYTAHWRHLDPDRIKALVEEGVEPIARELRARPGLASV